LASVSYGQAIETINYASGAVYVGETQRGQRHGSGTYTIVDGKEIHRNLVDQYLSRLTFDIRLRVK